MPVTVGGGSTTLEYFDGFDDYNTAQMLRYWQSANNYSIGAGGRNGTNCLSYNNNGSQIALTLPSQATRTVGFAFKISGLTNGPLVAFQDGSTNQIYVTLNANGTLAVYAGSGTLFSVSSLAINASVWYYIEFSATINNVTGSYTLKVNGVIWASGSGVNTRNTANNSANGVFFNGVGGGPNYYLDDFYSRADGTFMGDQRVETHLPSANGATNVWVPSAGSNFACVDDNPSDEDATYVSSANVGDIDLYAYPPLATTTGVIAAVMVCSVERVDTAGVATYSAVYRSSGGAVHVSSGVHSIGATTYAAYMDIQGLDPSTSAAWTIAGVNGSQYGIERLS
jgi:hypothetical protein